MGGRGSKGQGATKSVKGGSSKGKGNSVGGGGGTKQDSSIPIPSFTKASVSKMSRKELETLATAMYANNALKQGISLSDGVHRARSLMSGNTTAQLRKYVAKGAKGK